MAQISLMLSIFLATCIYKVYGGFDMVEYYKMPPKYRPLDDYDRCLKATNDLAVYCAARTILKPNPTNDVWKIIEKYNRTKQFFRHDLILSAYCVNWCLDRLANGSYDEYYLEKFPITGQVYSLDPTLINDTLYYREKYSRELNKCVNMELKQKYNLMGYTIIEFCNSNRDVEQYDYLDYLFIALLILTITLVCVATVYDKSLNESGTMEHYQINYGNASLPVRLLLSFSLPRNWYRLISTPKTTIGKDLRYVQGIRTFTCYAVIHAHVFLGFNFAPASNPEWIEETYQNLFSMLLVNGMLLVQAFFTISGFLLTIQFVESTKHFQKRWDTTYFLIAMIYRYVRLTPVYAFMILFDATWLVKINSGPGWKRIAEVERSYCRRNWWTNLLYVNNYVNVPETCLPQSWFLSADYQLFAIALILLILIWRYPNKTKIIMSVAIVLAYAISFFATYFGEFEGIYIVPPEERKYMNQHREFRDNYAASHISAGNYFIGMVIGLLYHDFKKRGVDVRKNKWVTLSFYAVPVLGYGIILSSYLFYAYDFEKPSVWMSLYSVFSRNMWGVFGAILMYGFVGKLGSFVMTIFNSPIFNPLGRVVYCMYLVHFSIARWLTGDFRAIQYLSGVLILHATLSVYTISLIVGTVMCLCLEFPMTAMLKEIFRKNIEKSLNDGIVINKAELSKMYTLEKVDATNNNEFMKEQTKV